MATKKELTAFQKAKAEEYPFERETAADKPRPEEFYKCHHMQFCRVSSPTSRTAVWMFLSPIDRAIFDNYLERLVDSH